MHAPGGTASSPDDAPPGHKLHSHGPPTTAAGSRPTPVCPTLLCHSRSRHPPAARGAGRAPPRWAGRAAAALPVPIARRRRPLPPPVAVPEGSVQMPEYRGSYKATGRATAAAMDSYLAAILQQRFKVVIRVTSGPSVDILRAASVKIQNSQAPQHFLAHLSRSLRREASRESRGASREERRAAGGDGSRLPRVGDAARCRFGGGGGSGDGERCFGDITKAALRIGGGRDVKQTAADRAFRNALHSSLVCDKQWRCRALLD